MSRPRGGYIGFNRVPAAAGVANEWAASGVWTMREAESLARATTWPHAGDPYSSSVRLLLNMQGANNSTTFTDSSPDGRTVTRQDGAVIKTDQFKFGSSSGYFDGTNDRLTVAMPALGTGDFTFETYARLDSGNTTFRHLCDTHNGNTPGWAFGVDSSQQVFFFVDGFLVQTGSVSANTWHHFAASRNSGTLRVFFNGSQVGSNASYTEDIPAMTEFTVGGWGARAATPPQFDWKGYLQQVRFTYGVGRYQAAFIPPSNVGA